MLFVVLRIVIASLVFYAIPVLATCAKINMLQKIDLHWSEEPFAGSYPDWLVFGNSVGSEKLHTIKIGGKAVEIRTRIEARATPGEGVIPTPPPHPHQSIGHIMSFGGENLSVSPFQVRRGDIVVEGEGKKITFITKYSDDFPDFVADPVKFSNGERLSGRARTEFLDSIDQNTTVILVVEYRGGKKHYRGIPYRLPPGVRSTF